ncbi:glycosyltransferase family 39 protein [Candidatus Woesebacteria bacterium]|nr:glycosyltransferase family 39 protein [Candidatus Woesebacteria bacterium]
MKYGQTILNFIAAHIVLLLIISGAAYLRFTQLETHTIFFGDAGKDLFRSYAAYTSGTLPLTGIESSRPYLHQGPLSTWLSMLTFAFAGTSTHAQAIVFAFMSMLAVIALYELSINYLQKWVAYAATVLMSVFPLAVAHARMPYHTTLIPLAFVFFLWSAYRLFEAQTAKNILLFICCWAVLCMTELSNIPLLLLGVIPFIPNVLRWRKHTLSGITSFSAAQVPVALDQFYAFAARIGSISGSLVTAVLSGLAVITWIHTLQNKSKIPTLIRVTLYSGLILLAAYLVNGQVSEAYMPPFFVIGALLSAYGLHVISTQNSIKTAVTLLVILYALGTGYSIHRTNFFVGTQPFAYESTGELQKIAGTLAALTQGKPYQLLTQSRIEERIPSYFDNLKWILYEKEISLPGTTGKRFFLLPHTELPPRDLYLVQSFTTQKLYIELSEL